MDFINVFTKFWVRLEHKMTVELYFFLKKRGDDPKVYIKKGMLDNVSKKIEDKLEVQFDNEKDINDWYDRWVGDEINQRVSLYNAPFITFHSEIFLYDRKELFDLFYSFKNLPEKDKDSFLKQISPSEEYYINEVRNERLEEIFAENYNSPFQNNI